MTSSPTQSGPMDAHDSRDEDREAGGASEQQGDEMTAQGDEAADGEAGDTITSLVERVTSLLLPALDDSFPGPRQRAAAASRTEIDSFIRASPEMARGAVEESARFLSSLLSEIADGRRPADEAQVDLSLRSVALMGRIGAARTTEELKAESLRAKALFEEAAELARAYLDEEHDAEEYAELAAIFADEARRHIARARDAMRALRNDRGDKEALRDLFRAMHTLKGGAATVGEPSLMASAHTLEDLLSGAINAADPVDEAFLDLAEVGLEETAEFVDRLGLEEGPPAHPESGGPEEIPSEESEAQRVVRVRIDHLESLLFDASELGSARAKAAAAVERLGRLTRRARGRRIDLAARMDAFVSDHVHPLPRRAFYSDEEMERERRRAVHSALACASEMTELDRELSQTMDAIQWLSRDLACDVERVGGAAARIRATVNEMRFVPMADLLERYESPIVEWAEQAHRLARIVVEAKGARVDRGVAEKLAAPLVQLSRNAVAHGIEPPEERERAGKPATATIVLRALEDGADLVLEVEDDGRGMEPEELRRAAVEKGLLSEAEALAMPDLRLPDLIFLPGFSTRREADSLSGRGFGLDIVASTVSRLGGVVSVSSIPGRGTKFSARMTPSTSCLPVLGVRSGAHHLALPLAAVRETLLLGRDDAGGAKREWRGIELPILRLSQVIGEPDPCPERASLPAVVLGHGGRHALLLVEGLLGREEGTPRPLGPILDCLPLYSGAVVGGDGKAKLVLDASYLLSIAQGLYPWARSYSRSR